MLNEGTPESPTINEALKENPEKTAAPVEVDINEAEKLLLYQRALSNLSLDDQIAKMNAVRSEKNLQRFLGVNAPSQLIARFGHRLNELPQESLTQDERERVELVQHDIYHRLQAYLDLFEQDAQRVDITKLSAEIHEGKTQLVVALGSIQEALTLKDDARTNFDRAIQAGFKEGYQLITASYLEEGNITMAEHYALEALHQGFSMPVFELAFALYRKKNFHRCIKLLADVCPEKNGEPFTILLEHAITTHNNDRIHELMLLPNRASEDLGFMLAVSHFLEGDYHGAQLEFQAALIEHRCNLTAKRVEKFSPYDARVYMAEHLKGVLTHYRMEELGNKILNLQLN